MDGLSGLQGKIAVVTGSTQGLGEAVARLLASRGAAGILVTGRDEARGQEVVQSLRGAGTKAELVVAALEDIDQVRGIVRRCEEAFGRVDILVNAAAITDRGSILDTDPALFDRMFAINVRAPFFLMQDAIRVMRRNQSGGAIVNILSMSGHGGQSFLAAYGASKTALATLTRNAAYTMMREHIRINGLNIGWMDSPGEHAIQKRVHDAPDDWLARAEAGRPVGRLLKPDEVARTVAFLCSDESGMMTGSIIDFDQQVLGCGDAIAEPPHLPAG